MVLLVTFAFAPFLQCTCFLCTIRENKQYNSIFFFLKDQQTTLMEPHKFSQNPQQPSSHEKPASKPTHQWGCLRDHPPPEKFLLDRGIPRPSAGPATPTFHLPPHHHFSNEENRQTRRQCSSPSPPLSRHPAPPPTLFHAPVAPQTWEEQHSPPQRSCT